MYARAVEDADARLRALRHEEWERLGLAVVALGTATVAATVAPSLALPLFVGGLVVGALGLRALWRRWDLVERLAGDPDALVIPEVRAYATREATMERRQTFASFIRTAHATPSAVCSARCLALASELEALAADLEDEALELDPAAAVACMRLVSDVAGSPLLNASLPAEDLRAQVCRIRSGFSPRPPAARPAVSQRAAARA
jgi:hypothetical protein